METRYRDKRRVNIKLTFIRQPETQLQMTANVAPSAGCVNKQLLADNINLKDENISVLSCVFAAYFPQWPRN